ncbi:conserved hypothetical protein [Vibrio chagasii]|nr:conserved hypothetical protein [Vibrio chagasii]CDU05738.1 hypothetical protein VCR14J2_390363 [Vibrio coralliirubri]
MVMLLTGCSQGRTSVSISATKYIYQKPPLPLVEACTYEDYTGSVWNDLAEYAKELQLEIVFCQLQNDKLKEAYEPIE